MWSTRFAGVLIALSGAAADAHGAACPATSNGMPLSYVTVFDGPPSENASLVPDATVDRDGSQVSTWRVGGIYRSGRRVYLTCEYGTTTRLTVPVNHARLCRYAEHGAAKSLACR